MIEPSVSPAQKVTDAIPRVTLEQLFNSLKLLADRGRATFDDIRILLQKESSRRAPGSREAMWTSTRDVLAELQRLGYARTGPLPRRRSEVDRLRDSPCEITPVGAALAASYAAKREHAFDALLLTWGNEHPYFRAVLSRLCRGPLFVPDVTGVHQIGEYEGVPVAELARRVADNCLGRLQHASVPESVREMFRQALHERFAALDLPDEQGLRANAKQWVDLVQDSVVLPSFLLAESLPFDPVTFQHLIRLSQQFLCASWTSSHPGFAGRVIHPTCDFNPPAADPAPLQAVTHHGKTWAAERFELSLLRAYETLVAGRAGGYVDAYALRALVCVEISIRPKVFELCLHDLARAPQPGRPTVYTDLPMRPPPSGESYVELGGHRVELIKLVS